MGNGVSGYEALVLLQDDWLLSGTSHPGVEVATKPFHLLMSILFGLGSQSFLISKIIDADMHAQMIPALFEQPPGLVLREYMKLVDETDARVELKYTCSLR